MRCRGRVYGTGPGFKMPRQCSNKVSDTGDDDGYCKIHHPAKKAARQQERDAKKERLYREAKARRKANQCPYCHGTGTAGEGEK